MVKSDAFAGEDGTEGVKEDGEVEEKIAVLVIEEIVFQSLKHLGKGGSIAVFDHAQGGDAGTEIIQQTISRNLFGDERSKVTSLGTRADKGHIAFQYVPELRQFIQTVST
jgi:hypothetical protein